MKRSMIVSVALCITMLTPSVSVARVVPLNLDSGFPLPFHSPRDTSSSSSASSVSSAKPVASRTARVALRQLAGYEKAAAGRQLSRTLRQVVALTNTERAKYGLSRLTDDEGLNAFAQGFARDMDTQGYFNHETPEGLDFQDRLKNSVYFKALSACGTCRLTLTAAENIAVGQLEAADVVDDWIASPEHHKNILDEDVTTIGVGRVGRYWVQVFIGIEEK